VTGEMNYRIEVTSGENVLAFFPGAPLRLLADGVKGFDMADFEATFGYAADGNGAFVKGIRFPERRFELRFEIGEDDGLWRKVVRAFASPGKECMISADFGEGTRRIAVIPSGKAEFERETLFEKTVVTLRFAACEPFFMGERSVAAGYGDPLKVVNPGEVPCGAVVTISAIGGEVVNPSVACGDAYVRVTAVLSDGDTVVIDTRNGKKGVWLNGEECFSFDWTSSFFSLDVGENMLSVDADSGKEFMAVRAEVVPLYFGV